LTGGLLFGDSLDMYDVFEAVDGGHFSFAAFAGASDYKHFVVFADGDGSDIVFFSEFFGERGTHDGPSDAGRCAVVCCTRLPSGRVEGAIDLRHLDG